jgi:hypothetical protein
VPSRPCNLSWPSVISVLTDMNSWRYACLYKTHAHNGCIGVSPQISNPISRQVLHERTGFSNILHSTVRIVKTTWLCVAKQQNVKKSVTT